MTHPGQPVTGSIDWNRSAGQACGTPGRSGHTHTQMCMWYVLLLFIALCILIVR